MSDLFFTLPYVVDLDKPAAMTVLRDLFVTKSKKAHKIIITLKRGGVPVDFDGTVAATMIYVSDMVSQDATGKAEAGKVTLTFPDSFYDRSGLFRLVIFASDDGAMVPVFGAEGNMIAGETDSRYDPNNVVPSIAEVLAQLDAAKNATTAANNATTAANNAAASANSAASKANTATSNANAATTAANNASQAATTAAGNANTATTNANNAAGAANQAAGRAESVASKSPYIGDNGNWYVYDVEQGTYVDSGHPARGETGAVEGLEYFTGSPSTLGTASPGTANGVARGDHVHPMPTAAQVGARDADWMPTAEDVGARPNSWMPTAADVGAFAVPDGAGAHNSIYRGKDLGSEVTAEQYASIADGTFVDLFIGDYWTIGGVNYRIAAFDYYLNTGDTECTTHHITIVPDSSLYNHKMNDSNVTTGAYVGSRMYTAGLNQAKTTINNAFGSAHVLKHRQYLQNAVTNGYASGGSWYDSTVELMTEQNMYGCKIFGNCQNGTALPDSYTVDKSQYPLFASRPDMISNRSWFWLRDVVSAAYFAYVYQNGDANYGNASSALGVRPAFSIVG